MLRRSQTLLKISALTLVLILGMVAVVSFILVDIRQILMESRQEKVRELVMTARGVADYFRDQAKRGLIDQESARKQAFAVMNYLRFDKDNYFFAYDYDGMLAMIPSRPDLVGQPRWDAKSPDGVYYVRRLVEEAKNGGGFYTYGYDNGGQFKVMRQKISYGTPFDDWRIALGAGIYIDDVDQIFWEKLKTFGGVSLLMIVIALVVATLIARSIVRPLTDITSGMTELAAGNLEVAVPHTRRGGEIGLLARAFQIFRENAIRLEREREAKELAERQSIESRRRALHEAAVSLEESVGAAIRTVRETCDRARADAASMISAVGETQEQAMIALDRSNHSAAAVQSVAGATEELSASAAEIDRQVTTTTNSAREAATEAEAAIEAVRGLAGIAGKIGQIIVLIRDVAGRTNLLALNASIEAARAGDHGRGFNVVAQEVKALASQTAHATLEIAEQVAAIQSAVNQTETTITRVGGAIQRVSAISVTVASSITQQRAAIAEIGRATVSTAEATDGSASAASAASVTAEQAGRSAGSVSKAMNHLTSSLDDLGQQVESFIGRLDGGGETGMKVSA